MTTEFFDLSLSPTKESFAPRARCYIGLADIGVVGSRCLLSVAASKKIELSALSVPEELELNLLPCHEAPSLPSNVPLSCGHLSDTEV